MSLGPLTTSFTPPADCIASSQLYWVETSSTFYWLHGQPLQTSCFPDNYSPYQNQYYSPGICPSGYTRACESLSTSSVGTTVTQATCCPQGNYGCAPRSSSYSYPWGPTLGCMSVYRVDMETSFTTIDGTLKGDETAGTPMSVFAPGTIMAYGIIIQNGQATTTAEGSTTTQASGSASNTLQTITSAQASETASTSTGIAATTETQSSSGGGGLSTGAAAGIGIATAVGIMAIGGAALWIFWTRRRKRKQQKEVEERARGRAAMTPGAWSESTWATTPHTYQRPINWQPSELAQEGEPREMSGETRLPAEKDGNSSYWR